MNSFLTRQRADLGNRASEGEKRVLNCTRVRACGIELRQCHEPASGMMALSNNCNTFKERNGAWYKSGVA